MGGQISSLKEEIDEKMINRDIHSKRYRTITPVSWKNKNRKTEVFYKRTNKLFNFLEEEKSESLFIERDLVSIRAV